MNGGATDSSGNGNNGTANNTTYINGRFGQAASFAGNTGSYITSPAHHPVNAWATFSFWVNMNISQAGSLWEWSPTPSQCNYFFRFNVNDVAPNYGIWFVTSDTTWVTQDILVSWTNVFSTGTWVHVGGTIASNWDKRLYVNGRFVSSSNQGGTINNNSIQTFIGKINNWAFQTPLLGSVDELIIETWTPWTDKKFNQYYSNALGRYQTTLI